MNLAAIYVMISVFSILAAHPAQATDRSASCVGDTYEKDTPQFLDDPYYPAAVMKHGKYKGQCIDTSWQRPVVPISQAAAEAAEVPPGYFAIANFTHQGRYWIAMIPMGGVEEVIFQMEHFKFFTQDKHPGFGVPSAHTELRFKFKPGMDVILVPQSQLARAEGQKSEVRLSDIIYSVELVGPKNVNDFNFVSGMLGDFAIVYRFCSLHDKFNYMITQQHHKVEQWALNVTDEQKQKLLLNAIATSYQEGLGSIYNTASKNCTSEAFRLLDETLSSHSSYGKPNPFTALIANIPSRSKFSLKARGLIDDRSRRPDLDQEFASANSTVMP
jgi:hypothetical protein